MSNKRASKSIGDLIVRVIDDAEQIGEPVIARDVADELGLPYVDALDELTELIEEGRVEMMTDETLRVAMEERDDE